jgi:cell wall-associated NlpC family hydrolase
MPFQLPLTAVDKLPLPSVGEGWPVPSEVKPHSGGEGAIPNSAFAIPNWDTSSADSSPFLLAQATDQPIAEDLAETPDVQFTDAIRAKAQELGGKPLKIYEWVRNNIEYAPTYGSIQGADQCLQSKICNDIDTASLLIALLRVSGVYSHYEYSTIEIPIEQAMNWVGGVTDPKMVGTILATNGIPAKMLVSGGTYKAVQLEHVYVSAFIDYIPSRGAVHRQGDTWIPLDPSFKQYEFKRGMDLYAAMGISGEKYLMDYITDTSSLTIPTELQASFPAYTISPYQYYSKRLFNYVDTNLPAATYQDIFGADTIEASRTIIQKEYPYLLGTLPYKVIATGTIYTSLPDNLRHKVTFTIENADSLDAGLTYTTTQPEIAGKRVTLSYVPATTADEALVSRYGTLLSVPPYLLNVKVVLKINGVTLATGNTVGLGQEQTFNMTFTIPNLGTEFVTNKVTTGEYSAIAILSQKVPVTQAGDKMETLINNIGSSDLDDLLGQMLNNVGISYFHHLNFEEELYAKNFQMFVVKGLSEAMITSHAVTNSLFGVPCNIAEGGIGIDVDKNEYLPFSYDGNQDRARDFMIVSGLGSSAWEDRVLQAFYDIPSVSAARLLRLANQQAVPVYTIDNGNISTILTQIQVSSEVSDVIRNAVNTGKKVIVSKTGVQYEGWNGVGYIVLDPSTGAAGYMISSGEAGGMGTRQPATSVRNVSQYFWGDGSALKTIYGRTMILLDALSLIGTTYHNPRNDPPPAPLTSGADPNTGFDCSGFVYYLYTTTYGKAIFGPQRLWTVSAQHDYLNGKNMTHPYEEKLDGDILWSDSYRHTGIYYGVPITGTFSAMDSVIHANHGKWFQEVVITSTNNAAFSGAPSGSIMTDIGRPVP